MLNATEPKIVNGPEILDKYVGEAEKNIRNLFIDAEADEARLGSNSPLHIIIFDEIDAICKKRGSVAGSSGVNDTVVNQLLSKIDGVDTLNNILVIGMTNRPDMIDEALTRPGRLEVTHFIICSICISPFRLALKLAFPTSLAVCRSSTSTHAPWCSTRRWPRTWTYWSLPASPRTSRGQSWRAWSGLLRVVLSIDW